MATADIPLSEPFAIVDTFVSGVADVHELAPGLYRVSYYAEQKSSYDGSPERVLVAKFIVSALTLAAMSGLTASANDTLKVSHPEHRPTSVN